MGNITSNTKFFTNAQDAGDGKRTLLAKLEKLAGYMGAHWSFKAVSGYLRFSGYSALRNVLGKVDKIQILVGIDAGDFYQTLNANTLFTDNARIQRAKKETNTAIKQDIEQSSYSPALEQSVANLREDIEKGLLEIRIHKDRALHAKFYLCLPEGFNEDTDGRVIMGSSNLTPLGLGVGKQARYELNVELRDYVDVAFCRDEFERLWTEGVELSPEEVKEILRQTYLGYQPSPYELYLKVLIDTFGEQVEDNFTLQLPEGVQDLKYQRDAVVQGYQMLLRHHGLFLADVVGLGKTVVAAMIARRFVEANGNGTNILVVYPPALEENWTDTFARFGLTSHAQYVSNGSLPKVLEGQGSYKDKGAFDLIIVDEAHGFRNSTTGKFDSLQRLCKADRAHPGLLGTKRKYVMLLSATPLNNSPQDLLSQLLLFQDGLHCTIDGIPDLPRYFAPLQVEYKNLREAQRSLDAEASYYAQADGEYRASLVERIDQLYEKIRRDVIEKVTIRRTRRNILHDPDYKADLDSQGISFPEVKRPELLYYRLLDQSEKLFYDTLGMLVNANDLQHHLHYARYRALEFLVPELKGEYKNADLISQNLTTIYRVLLVKRLESSFYAFKRTLTSLWNTTRTLIEMYEMDQVMIAPKSVNVNELIAKEKSTEKIIDIINQKEGKAYPHTAFDPQFYDLLKKDRDLLEEYCNKWKEVDCDPKLNTLLEALKCQLLSPVDNPSGKLVIFSESEDTVNYLYEHLPKKAYGGVLCVTSANRDKVRHIVQENFDANLPKAQWHDDYSILLSTDVLAEGVNLHRANTVVHYDTPWNATRLIQRLGRVNRIGSTASQIFNYVFYPSPQGDQVIDLYRKSLVKLQGFHSAYGEDNQIFTPEEVLKEVHLFDADVKDSVDKRLELLHEVREVFKHQPELYARVKALPVRSRAVRHTGSHAGESVVFIASSYKTEFYHVTHGKAKVIDLFTALDYLRAAPEEKALPLTANQAFHYDHVERALKLYAQQRYMSAVSPAVASNALLGASARKALGFLQNIITCKQTSPELRVLCKKLFGYVKGMVYVQLPKELLQLNTKYSPCTAHLEDIEKELAKIAAAYSMEAEAVPKHNEGGEDEAKIVVAETFI